MTAEHIHYVFDIHSHTAARNTEDWLYVWQGCEQALRVLQEHFPDMEILSLSGNFCTDKKSSAVNWWQLITYLLTSI